MQSNAGLSLLKIRSILRLFGSPVHLSRLCKDGSISGLWFDHQIPGSRDRQPVRLVGLVKRPPAAHTERLQQLQRLLVSLVDLEVGLVVDLEVETLQLVVDLEVETLQQQGI